MIQFTSFSQTPFHIWGVLNCTPDSFYDGSGDGVEKRVEKAHFMIEEGAEVIDVGGESTRPGASAVSAEEEMDRVLPVIEKLSKAEDTLISIDTSKSKVARAALDLGAHIVNDVSAGGDPEMASVVAEKKAPIVLMHMKGTPRTMQKNPEYQDVVQEVENYLIKRKTFFVDQGVAENKILFDPGIGFGKSLDHNIELMSKLDVLEQHSPVLLGVSRKSFISGVDPSSKGPEDRLPGSLAPLAPALKSGVTHFRVHDVSSTRQFILVTQRLMEKKQ